MKFVLLLTATAFAHDVPDNVSIQAFLKPTAGRLQAVVRIPLKALIDIEFPSLPGTGYLDLKESEPYAAKAATLWVSDLLTLYENGARLPKPAVQEFRIDYDTDPSFSSFERAVAHINGPKLPATALVDWGRAVLDVLLDVPIQSDRSDFSLQPRWGRLGIRVIVTAGFLPPDGGLRTFEYEGDPARYHLNPKPGNAARTFFRLGFAQVTNQADYALFLLCLVLVFPQVRALLPPAVLFTVAYSLALIVSANLSSATALWAGTLMAAAVVYMGFESVIGGKTPRRAWIAALVGGLAFGAGSWFELRPELQFGGAHPLLSRLSFNAGMEAGQLTALAILVPGVWVYFRIAGKTKINLVILAGLAIHMALHRMFDRATAVGAVLPR